MADRLDDARPPDRLPWRDGDDLLRLDVAVVAEHHRVVIDTQSLTNSHAEVVLVGQVLPQLKRLGREAIVSVRTIQALQAQSQSRVPALAEAARLGLRNLKAFQDDGAVIPASDPHPIPGDPLDTELLLTELFVGYQQREALCLVTQNESLAWSVLRNARSGAFSRAAPVVAAFVANDGLRNWAPKLAQRSVMPTTDWPNDELDNTALASCRIFVDTCSWMLDDKQDAGRARGVDFLRTQLLPLVEAHRNALMVPDRVRLELEDQARRPGDQQAGAVAGLQLLQELRASGLAVLAADPDEVAGNVRFADPVFVRLAVRFQSEFDLCFVTQDEKLATLLMGQRNSGTGRRFLVVFIPMTGNALVPWRLKLARKKPAAAPEASSAPVRQAVQPRAPRPQPARRLAGNEFRILSEITRTDPAPLPVSELPSESSSVVGAKSGPIRLVSRIAGGGEGTVYRTDRPGMVCKVYHPACLTQARRAKLLLMTSRDVQIDGVCWPHEVVSNSRGEFVGFTMPSASGEMLRTSVFAKALLAKHFPQWTRIELTELAITMLRTIRELHYIGVLVGDVNPQNILVTDQHHICIVDVDSMQVEGFPCTVGTETFTPPERLGIPYTDFLRTHEDELFAVATLLFQTLFPGKAPYAAQGGGDVKENMKAMRFAYGKEADGRPPVGAWQFIWSHLNPRLKEAFTGVFARGDRVGIDDLVQALEMSLREMREGKRDLSLFPDKPWQREGQTVSARCEDCPPDKAVHQISVQLAERLKADGKSFVCSSCGALRKMAFVKNTREVECALRISPTCEKRFPMTAARLEALRTQGKALWCRACADMQRAQWGNQQRTPRAAPAPWRAPIPPASRLPSSRSPVGSSSSKSTSKPPSGGSRTFRANWCALP